MHQLDLLEHLEVLYDNDFECKVVTDEIGAKYYRPEMPNASEAFIDCLTDVVLKKKNLYRKKKGGACLRKKL